MNKVQINEWYGNGLTEAQLDGSGAESGSVYEARNYVALGVITQAEADEIRAADAQGEEAIHILEGVATPASPARTAKKTSKKTGG